MDRILADLDLAAADAAQNILRGEGYEALRRHCREHDAVDAKVRGALRAAERMRERMEMAERFARAV
jgi:hemerythrin